MGNANAAFEAVTAKEFEFLSNSCYNATVVGMQGLRPTMEDQHTMQIGSLSGPVVFGVFDGHGGDECSSFIKERINDFLNEVEDPFDEKQITAWLLALDEEYYNVEPNAEDCGSTMVFCVVRPLPKAKKESDDEEAVGPSESKLLAALEQSSAASEFREAIQALRKELEDERSESSRAFKTLEREWLVVASEVEANRHRRVGIADRELQLEIQAQRKIMQQSLAEIEQETREVMAEEEVGATEIEITLRAAKAQEQEVKAAFEVELDIAQRNYESQLKHINNDISTEIEIALRAMWDDKENNNGPRAPKDLEDEFEVLVVNIGDSRAYLCLPENGGVKALTEDHHPMLPAEKERIEANGGWVERGRVDGCLAMSRAMGDWYYKIPHSEKKVIAVPDFQRTTCPRGSWLFIACDGIFEKLTQQQVGDFLMSQIMPDTEDPFYDSDDEFDVDVESTLTNLCHMSLKAGSRDNMTAMLVALLGVDRWDLDEEAEKSVATGRQKTYTRADSLDLSDTDLKSTLSSLLTDDSSNSSTTGRDNAQDNALLLQLLSEAPLPLKGKPEDGPGAPVSPALAPVPSPRTTSPRNRALLIDSPRSPGGRLSRGTHPLMSPRWSNLHPEPAPERTRMPMPGQHNYCTWCRRDGKSCLVPWQSLGYLDLADCNGVCPVDEGGCGHGQEYHSSTVLPVIVRRLSN